MGACDALPIAAECIVSASYKSQNGIGKQNETRKGLCALCMLTLKPTTMSSMSKMMVRVTDSSLEESDMERLLAQDKKKRACRRLFWTEPSCSHISVSRLVDTCILYTLNA